MVRTSCRAFAVLLTCTCLGTMLIAQEKKVDAAATPQAQGPSDEMMKKWNEVKTPGEFHKKLDELVGTWDVESRALMGGPFRTGQHNTHGSWGEDFSVRISPAR